MIKCALCGCEKETRRSMHGHLISKHPKEYAASNYNMDNMTDGAPMRAHEREAKRVQRPPLFRRLKLAMYEEAAAIEAGYEYIDADGNLYTEEEADERGWI